MRIVLSSALLIGVTTALVACGDGPDAGGASAAGGSATGGSATGGSATGGSAMGGSAGTGGGAAGAATGGSAGLATGGGPGTGGTPGGPKPSWYTAAPDKTWIAMSQAAGSKLYNHSTINPEADAGFVLGSGNDHRAAVRKWNGATASGDYYILAFGGGHRGGSGNIVYQFGPLSSETPDWHWWYTDQAAFQKPSNNLNWANEERRKSGYYTDGLPVSRHTYNSLVYVPDLGGGDGNRVIAWGGAAIWSPIGGDSTKAAASFHLNPDQLGGTYDAQGYLPDAYGVGVGTGAAWDSVTRRVYHFETNGHNFAWLDPKTKTRNLISGSIALSGVTAALAIDPNRRIAITHRNAGGEHYLGVIDIDHDGRVGGTEGSLEKHTYASPLGSRASIVYHAPSDAFFAYDAGAKIYKLTVPSDYRAGGSTGTLNSSASYSWVAVKNGAGGATPPSDDDEGGIMSRFQWVESIDAFAVIVNSGHSASDEMFVYKIPKGGM